MGIVNVDLETTIAVVGFIISLVMFYFILRKEMKKKVDRDDLDKSEQKAKDYTDDRVRAAHKRISENQSHMNEMFTSIDNKLNILIETGLKK